MYSSTTALLLLFLLFVESRTIQLIKKVWCRAIIMCLEGQLLLLLDSTPCMEVGHIQGLQLSTLIFSWGMVIVGQPHTHMVKGTASNTLISSSTLPSIPHHFHTTMEGQCLCHPQHLQVCCFSSAILQPFFLPFLFSFYTTHSSFSFFFNIQYLQFFWVNWLGLGLSKTIGHVWIFIKNAGSLVCS